MSSVELELVDWRSTSPYPHFSDRQRYPLHCVNLSAI